MGNYYKLGDKLIFIHLNGKDHYIKFTPQQLKDFNDGTNQVTGYAKKKKALEAKAEAEEISEANDEEAVNEEEVEAQAEEINEASDDGDDSNDEDDDGSEESEGDEADESSDDSDDDDEEITG